MLAGIIDQRQHSPATYLCKCVGSQEIYNCLQKSRRRGVRVARQVTLASLGGESNSFPCSRANGTDRVGGGKFKLSLRSIALHPHYPTQTKKAITNIPVVPSTTGMTYQ